jgi:hypothetical protein
MAGSLTKHNSYGWEPTQDFNEAAVEEMDCKGVFAARWGN